MYRVYDEQPEPEINVEGYYPNAGRNCEDWQRLTSESIPLEDIYYVVYTMTLEEFEAIYDQKEIASKNLFIEWITKKDQSILDFLLLAKTNEYIRLKRNSRWYYPTMKVGARMTLEDVVEKALAASDKRLRDRYLLQAVRALFSLSRYNECIELWETEISQLPENNHMRQLIQPYVAGAEFRVNRSEKAITFFAQLGDVESMLYCSGRNGEILSTIDALDLICQYAPNSTSVSKTLQSFVRSIEPIGEFGWDDEFEDNTEVQKLFSLCLKMAKNKKSNSPAMWYYTAAFLSDLRGDLSNASYLLGLAENSKKTDYIDESIRVFRIYIDAKTLPYNSSYENKLFSQLKWLDDKIVNGITEDVRAKTAREYTLLCSESYYYWNDMMRRILLAEVCPRMISAGKHIRALQLANMADNRLLGLVNRIDLCYQDWDEDNCKGEYKGIKTYTMQQYRYNIGHNAFDYRNHFFEMVDSLGVDTTIKYVQDVRQPVSEFDRYLNARGYTGSDYLNDIAGTQCLRNMRYKEAVEYLGAVSEDYKDHLNVYVDYDPFSIERESIELKSEFRYDFACRMYSLEQSIDLTSEPNRKARLLIEYATGLRNSFDLCWGLTQYYRGTSYWGQVCEKRDWEKDEYTQAARSRAKELIKLACDIVTDDEVAAEINYALCNYRIVADKYPNTKKGKLVIGQCDNLKDYRAISYR